MWKCKLSTVTLTEVEHNLSSVPLLSVWRLEGVLNVHFQVLCTARDVQNPSKMKAGFLMSLRLGGGVF